MMPKVAWDYLSLWRACIESFSKYSVQVLIA